MNIIKGFVTISAYVNNTPGQTAPLGELSTWSRTYSYEKGEYQDATVPGYKLTTFRAADNDTGTEIVLQASLVQQILRVVGECMAYASSHIRPYDSIDFKNTLLANFYQKMGDLHIGDFVENGTLALPEWISWNSLDHQNAYVKIWLSDQAFQDQYDDYKIVVIPPLQNLDHFFNAYNVALTEINDRTSDGLNNLIQAAKGVNPETYIRFLDFDFYNSLNLEQKNRTNWAVLVYGKAGDNIDAIKDAMVEYILANSSHSRAEWEVILPDLFKRTEFVLLPRWDLKSIPNLTDLASLYASMLNPMECVQFAKNAINFYPQVFIESNVTVFPYDYKALSLVTVNGDTNVDNKKTLKQVFPDYIPVPSTSPDFNRMQIKTRNWLIFLEQLLIAAETVGEFSSVPTNLRKQRRGGLLFVSGLYDNVNYLVAARSNSIYQP